VAAINHPLGHARRGRPLPSAPGRLQVWLVLAIGFAGISALLPVVQNSVATSRGFDIQAAQRQETQLNGEIGLLEADVASLTSLTRIERRAREIGLLPVDDPIYVTVKEAGPAPAKLPPEYLPKDDTRPVSSSPWWKSLFSWLP
jgi:hypothetical protein